MQLLMNGLIAGSLAALIAGGLALVYGVLGVFNLALGQMVLVGGYATWWFHVPLGLPLSASIVLGLLMGAALSWASFELFVNPFYKHHRFLPLVTTIALSMILDAAILLLWSERPRSIPTTGGGMISIVGMQATFTQLTLIMCTLLLLCGFACLFHSTPFGRKLRAVVQNPLAAMSLGVPAPLLHRIVFIMSGVFAAAGGIFLGIDQTLSTTIAFPLTIKAYAAIIAGGKGNIWGAVLCAYLIAILEQLLVGVHWFGTFYVSAGYQSTVALLFIIVFLLWKPQGLFATSQRLA